MPPKSAIEIAAAISAGAALIASSAVDQFVEHLWPRRSEVDLRQVLSRARLLLARASASPVVQELGVALTHQPGLEDANELQELVDAIVIGQIRRADASDQSI